VSLTTELFMSDEPVTRRSPASAFCADSIATFDKSAGPTDQSIANDCVFPVVPQDTHSQKLSNMITALPGGCAPNLGAF
jgi:hypothetical protein